MAAIGVAAVAALDVIRRCEDEVRSLIVEVLGFQRVGCGWN
jgi:hypothetical protein